jgi:hypothetical protein
MGWSACGKSNYYLGWQGEVNSERLPVFHQLDVRVEKTWHRRRMDLSAYLDVFNVYFAQNPFAAEYNEDYSELVTTASLPIIPVFGMSGRY